MTYRMTNTSKIWFEIEDECNLLCRFCYKGKLEVSSKSDCTETPYHTLCVLDKLFSSINVGMIAISGGEPVLYPNLEDVLHFICKWKIPIILATNGTLLDKQRICRYMELGVKTFQIPLHSANSEVHHYLTGKESWKNTVDSLLLIRESGGHVAIVFVATKINLCDFKNVLEIATILGIRKVIFNRFIPGGGTGKSHKDELFIADENEIKPVLFDANDFCQRYNMKVMLGTPVGFSKEEQERLHCIEMCSCPLGKGRRDFVVDKRGNLRQCLQSTVILGNIMEEDPNTILQKVCEPVRPEQTKDNIRNCILT